MTSTERLAYKREFQELKPWDEVQLINQYGALRGYNKLYTAGHGYLIVPKNDQHYNKARELCIYGFKGKKAVYLEEDCELSEFMDYLENLEVIQ